MFGILTRKVDPAGSDGSNAREPAWLEDIPMDKPWIAACDIGKPELTITPISYRKDTDGQWELLIRHDYSDRERWISLERWHLWAALNRAAPVRPAPVAELFPDD